MEQYEDTCVITNNYSSLPTSSPIPTPSIEERIEVKKYNIREIIPLLKQQNSRLIRKRYLEPDFRSYLLQIEPIELQQKYLELYDAFPAFKVVCAGAKHHHWWEGGLEQHCCEMLGMGQDIMELYPGDFTKFSKTDLIISIFLHDFAKVWLYRKITEEDRKDSKKRFLQAQVFTFNDGVYDILSPEDKTAVELMKRGIPVTEIQWSAVRFAEGGFATEHFGINGTTSTSRTIYKRNPLATFISMLDTYGANIIGGSLI
jgi:hypothetical protein